MSDSELIRRASHGHEQADRIEALELALIQSRAETAAAYERAANVDVLHTDEDGNCITRKLGFLEKNCIRALATQEQSAALDAVKAEAWAQGMREAAEMLRLLAEQRPLMQVRPTEIVRGRHEGEQAFASFGYQAILAAIQKGELK